MDQQNNNTTQPDKSSSGGRRSAQGRRPNNSNNNTNNANNGNNRRRAPRPKSAAAGKQPVASPEPAMRMFVSNTFDDSASTAPTEEGMEATSSFDASSNAASSVVTTSTTTAESAVRAKVAAASARVRLSNMHLSQSIAHQLTKGNYECMICTDSIRHHAPTWHCFNCFRVFHLGCIKKWAHQEESGSGSAFRCPSCQVQHQSAPTVYKCFCGKTTDPKTDGFLTPHSCGDPCGKKRGSGCPHPCTAPCHPGPCLDCPNKVDAVTCPCGKMEYQYGCGKPDPLRTCENICNKMLKCGNHHCTMRCHHGPCEPCTETVSVACKCGKSTKTLACGTKQWDCQTICNKLQRCGVHKCKVQCHSGNCPPCDSDPELIFTCPCGKNPVDPSKRTKCTDPVPTCGAICDKVLLCGRHHCTEPCHTGQCPPCEAKTQVTCPCGSTTAKVRCNDAPTFRCQKMCKMKLHCGRHDCSEVCCRLRLNATAHAQGLHQCQRTCNRRLGCGHHCTDPCHRGPCPPCYHVIGEELRCGCGAQVLEPPLPCGTLPPKCDLPCNKPLICGHEPQPHRCHQGECPKCTTPVEKPCVGGHTSISVMCHTPPSNVLCGRVCAKTLNCGHTCPKRCHKDACEDPQRKTCGQPCGKRLPCGHSCQAKCHQKACSTCNTQVEVTCECGIQTIKLKCKEYLQLVEKHKEKHAAQLAEYDAKKLEKEAAAAKDDDDPGDRSQEREGSNAVGDDADDNEASSPFLILAPCNEDCAYERRLAALSSVNAAGHSTQANHGGKKGGIKNVFSIRAWEFAKKNIDSVCSVERHLEDFIRSQERMKTLPPMNRDKRAVVHEVANFYHVGSEAVDKEPNRTCVLTRTPLTRLPQSKLSEAVYDNQCSPMRMVSNVFTNGLQVATNHTIVFEGQMLSEVGVNKVLKHHIGQFVLVGPDDYNECGVPPPTRKPLPKNTIPSHAFLAVFIRPADATAAHSMLRRNGCPIVFHKFGEKPPLQNTLDDNQEQQRPAELYIDGSSMGQTSNESSATPITSAKAATKASAWGAPSTDASSDASKPQGSWAARLQGPPRETSRQKETQARGKLETANRFGALGRQ